MQKMVQPINLNFLYLCINTLNHAKKKLPIGIQTFHDIRHPKENFVYIDKSQQASALISGYKYVFLSRPRRFGKSLFLDTLSEIFQGNKELFEGLYIYDKWDWEDTYPVIKISFANGDFSTAEKQIDSINYQLNKNARNFGLSFSEIENNVIGLTFSNLIERVAEKYNKKVVVLIDEYDKPILDNIHLKDSEIAFNARKTLQSFYSTLKANDAILKFVFLTGVSKFSKLNLFSGLNNIQDITLKKEFATITGYTHEDVKRSFTDYLEGVDLEKLKRWYNGYNYFGEPIYNPFDILLYFSEKEYKNYWWQTGNPSFLIELLKKKPYYLPDLENKIVSEETLNNFDIEHIDIIALLWQTGYLTFDKEVRLLDFVQYKMKVPNLEIQKSLNALFLDYLTDLHSEKSLKQLKALQSIIDGNFEDFQNAIHELFAAIPFQNYVKNNMGEYEGYYASVLYSFLATLGVDIIMEDNTNKGRIDMTMILPENIYILEFKVDKPSESALEQIKTKKYYEKYLNSEKQIYLMGIHFSSEDRNINEMRWEKLER